MYDWTYETNITNILASLSTSGVRPASQIWCPLSGLQQSLLVFMLKYSFRYLVAWKFFPKVQKLFFKRPVEKNQLHIPSLDTYICLYFFIYLFALNVQFCHFQFKMNFALFSSTESNKWKLLFHHLTGE